MPLSRHSVSSQAWRVHRSPHGQGTASRPEAACRWPWDLVHSHPAPPAEQPSFGHPRGLGPLTQSSQSSSKLCSLSPRGQHTVPGEECSQGVSPRLPALSEVEDSQSVLMEAVRPRLGPGRPRALQKACKKSGSCLPPGKGRQGTEGDQASLGNLSKPIAQPLRGQPHPQETG